MGLEIYPLLNFFETRNILGVNAQQPSLKLNISIAKVLLSDEVLTKLDKRRVEKSCGASIVSITGSGQGRHEKSDKLDIFHSLKSFNSCIILKV